jgi:hypothetical protein
MLDDKQTQGDNAADATGGVMSTAQLLQRSLVLSVMGSLLLATAIARPPRVVETSPAHEAVDVDPATAEIIVTFDQPMDPVGRSIVGGGDSYPDLGQPHWKDPRTIVIPVTLKPDHDYRLSINSDRFRNFVSRSGEPAEPYPLAFSTAPAGEAPSLDPALNKQSIEQLRRAIDGQYAYRDLRKVDWDAQFAQHGEKLQAAATPSTFAREAGAMLAAAGDMHVHLRVGERVFASHRVDAPMNVNLALLPRLVPNWSERDGVAIGRFPDGITYILIAQWSPAQQQALELAYQAIADADAKRGIIVDVRCNSGGDETIARQLAGCFIDEPKVYSRNTIRHNGAWHGPFDRIVEPNAAAPAYRGKVAVLQGRQCMSSNESFLLMMQAAGATLIGERSYGASGNPKATELANGVTVFLSSWQDMLPDGSLLEGEGVKPDIEVKAPPAVLQRGDPVLMAALKHLRQR